MSVKLFSPEDGCQRLNTEIYSLQRGYVSPGITTWRGCDMLEHPTGCGALLVLYTLLNLIVYKGLRNF